jgi:hypothetical protein
MRLVIVESPYAAGTGIKGLVGRWLNRRYARACMRDCLVWHSEAPFASHLLYTQPGVLSDSNPIERQYGIDAGLDWGNQADASVVYIDRGISRGMKYGIAAATKAGRPVEYRSLYLLRAPKPTDQMAAKKAPV